MVFTFTIKSKPTMRLNLIFSSILSVLLYTSCTRSNVVTITDSNISDTLPQLQNLVFEFSHDLTPDSLTGRWDTIQYLRFEPEVKGLFQWNDKRRLTFSPANGFRAATAYTIHLDNTLLKYSGKGLSLDQQALRFRTAPLRIDDVQTWWTLSPGSLDRISLQATLNFNYDIDPAVLLPVIQVELNGQRMRVSPGEQGVSGKINIRIDGLDRSMAGSGELRIRIPSGLKCVECSEAAAKLEFICALNPIDRLEFTTAETELQGNEGIISLNSNQPIDISAVEGRINISPAVSYVLESMESGIRIRGAFAGGSDYTITLSAGVQGMLGGKLTEDHTTTVSFGQQEPGLVFVDGKGVYLGGKGNRKIALQIINIPKVKVVVYKIYDNNILAFMHSNRYSEWYDSNSGSNFEYSDYEIERFGTKIMDQELNVDNLPRKEGMSLFSMDFNDELPYKGIYLITARSSENQWLKASKLVAVSDIGLMARKGKDKLFVFANGMKDANPLENVQVSVTSKNNQVLFKGLTGRDGAISFEGLSTKFSEFEPGMISVRKGSDFNFMLLNDTRIETSRFETGGYRSNATGYMTFLYGDREIYRPGETIHCNMILRNQQWLPVQGMPVKLRLLLPNGREVSSTRKTLNSQGAAVHDFKLAEGGVTGTYSLEAFTANDVLLTSKSISVEEFMPDRISVKAEAGKTIHQPGDSVVISAMATNLFGTPAAGRKYEIQFNLSKSVFQPEGFDGYTFSITGADEVRYPEVLRQGITGEDGGLRTGFVIENSYSGIGKLQGKAFITVFDETSRPVNRLVPFTVETQRFYFGIKTSDYYGSVGYPVQLSAVAVDGNGRQKDARARIQVIKRDYHNVLNRSYGDRLYYVSQKQDRILVDRVETVSGSGLTVPFVPRESGEYVFRISDPGSNRFVEKEFYAFGWGRTGNNAFAVNTEGTVEITSDKEKYAPGETARLLFKTPFNGRLLVTVEKDEVVSYHYLETEKKAAEMRLAINGNHLPNAYITATLFRKSGEESIPLTVAHGIKQVSVERINNRIPVTIKAVKKSGSNCRQKITVNTGDRGQVELTIAVVDEGILQLKNTRTPDPYDYFYQKRALMVEGFDLYPYLLPEYRLGSSSTGGDGYDLSRRVNPVTSKRVQLISSWSGIIKTDAQGNATRYLDIPSFSGDLRIMVSAYKDQSFGSAEAHMKVADPVVISSALPRFVSPGDTLSVPVTFTNTTGKVISCSVESVTAGPLKTITAKQERISLQPGKEKKLVYTVTANGTGEGKFTVNVNDGSSTYKNTTEIPVRISAGLQSRSGNGTIAGGKRQEIDLRTNFRPQTAEGELILSTSPVTAFADQMSYLLDYPHGCAEQTISIAFPQLYYADLVKSLSDRPGNTGSIPSNIQAAIVKLQSIQHFNGGIMTWPGQTETNPWTSTYAAHFLSEAKKAGYEVNQQVLEKLFEHLRKNTGEKRMEDVMYLQSNGDYAVRQEPARDIFYALFVLAVNNKPDKASMNFYRTKYNQLPADSRYLLSCTYLATGDRRTYSQLLPGAYTTEPIVRSTGGAFNSPVRNLSIALLALLYADPDQAQAGVLARQLSTALKKESWMSTQERAFSLLALGKFSRITAKNDIKAAITIAGGRKHNFTGADLVIKNEVVNEKLEINTTGNGTLYYFWTAKGQSIDGSFVPEDKNLRVRKQFLTRDGRVIQNNQFEQNDLIVIKITLENTSSTMVENVVVTDLLPAGMEIENPRVTDIPDLNWIKDNYTPEHLDIRDDRIHLYTSIAHQPQTFYYVARAINTGSYQLGPVCADAMYSGEYHSIAGGGRIQIR